MSRTTAPSVSPSWSRPLLRTVFELQDGLVDTLLTLRGDGPGPLDPIRRFLAEDHRFEIDRHRSGSFSFHSSPAGCLRRRI